MAEGRSPSGFGAMNYFTGGGIRDAPICVGPREQGTGMTDDALPTPRSIPHGYAVSAWCRACRHTVQLDQEALAAGGHGDVPLIHLPLRCRCGSDQFGVIVGAASTGKWQTAPSG